MFTGIVQAIGTVQSVEDECQVRRVVVEAPELISRAIVPGARLSVAGVCVTITRSQPNLLGFDVILPTAQRTTLGECRAGDMMNLERAARLGDEIGGHLVSGHVDFAATIVDVQKQAGNKTLRIRIPAGFQQYFLPRGYVAVEGASLTISDTDRGGAWLEVSLIPETRRATSLDQKHVGDRVNIEIDRSTQAVIDTTRSFVRFLSNDAATMACN